MFDTEIGIPNANTQKKERMITDEVNQNNISTQSKVELWLETMKDGCKKVNTMFGLSIDVDLRFKEELETMNNGFEEDSENADS